MTRHLARALVFLAVLAPSGFAENGGEAPAFICGIWPDRVLFFDQTTDTFSEALRLRHGAVTTSAHTPDRRRVFAVTDRMQAVEVIDTERREVVDELSLSTAERRVWIHRIFPNAAGNEVYLYVSVIRLEADRLVYEDEYNLVRYDLEAHRVLATFELPEEVSVSGRPAIYVSPDDETFYVLSKDIYQIDAESHEVVGKVVLSKPLHPGYGALRTSQYGLAEAEPGVLYGVYRTRDPIQEKESLGVARIDLTGHHVETFELGSSFELGGAFALAPDGKRGYAGLNDLVAVDMVKKKVLRVKEGLERGRTNTSLIVSHDGTKLYISGVGDTMYVYDAETLEPIKTIFAGGDFMMPPIELASSRSASGN